VTAVRIVGAGMTAFGSLHDRTLSSLAGEATACALRDAGIGPDDLGLVAFGNAGAGILTGQEMIRGQAALRDVLGPVAIVNVENACASSSSAFAVARMAVQSGQVDVALAVGAEKMVVPDRSRVEQALRGALVVSEDSEQPSADAPPFMAIYARMAREYQALTGVTREPFAAVAAKNRAHGALNPRAALRAEVTVGDVLQSREIVFPLTLYMCSPITDGAAAVVVASQAWCRQRGAPGVHVRGCAVVSGAGQTTDVVESAARRALEEAAVSPGDLDVIELHDAASPAELITLEQLGVAADGEAAAMVAAGETSLGGRLPVNPSGGLVSRGHPIGATGCAQLVELTDQLRGRCGPRQVHGARIALAENAGGWLGSGPGAAVVTILEGAP
jgi:acetyl-CoA acyltransferase